MDSIELNNEDNNEDMYNNLGEICLDLNLDTITKDNAWKSFQKIISNYILEGSKVEWLVCAIFVACKNQKVTTISKNIMEGNCISLIRLLHCANMSILGFFDKMKKWCDMANLPENLCICVNELESRFNVTKVIFFSKYVPLFEYLFDTTLDVDEQSLNYEKGSLQISNKINFADIRKHTKRLKKTNCDIQDLFEFCWILFIYVKGKYMGIGGDLVHCFNLLLCCLDFVYTNVILGMRQDLVNPSFLGVPKDFFSKSYIKASPDDISIIADLCQKTSSGALEIDAKSLRIHEWMPFIQKLMSEKVLRGEITTLTGLLQPENFETNLKIINKLYQELVLNLCFFDERIFLGENFILPQIITPVKDPKYYQYKDSQGDTKVYRDYTTGLMLLEGDEKDESEQSQEKSSARKNLLLQYEKPNHVSTTIQMTPLTGRRFLVNKKSNQELTPVSTASHEMNRLRTILSDSCCDFSNIDNFSEGANDETTDQTDQDNLIGILRTCPETTRKLLLGRVEGLKQTFLDAYPDTNPLTDTPNPDQGLYSPDKPHNKKFELAQSLYFCALEKILLLEKRCKTTNNKLPNELPVTTVTDAVPTTQASSFDFSGLLEHDDFNRSLLSLCVEIVLFCHQSRQSFPWIVRVFNIPPYVFYRVIELYIRAEDRLTRDMVKHLNKIEEQTLERLAWTEDSPLWEALRTTTVPWCKEVFASRNIEYVSSNSNQTTSSPFYLDKAPNNDQNSLSTTPHAHDKLPEMYLSGALPAPTIKSAPLSNNKPTRGGSLALFFRKVYHLSSVRLRDLCHKLDISDDLLHVIWTCFEYALVNRVQLMKDRHIDQLLMCSIYVMSKVIGQDRSFADIMRHYRTQPQAQNHVYRSVLINTKLYNDEDSENALAEDVTITTQSEVGLLLEGSNSLLGPSQDESSNQTNGSDENSTYPSTKIRSSSTLPTLPNVLPVTGCDTTIPKSALPQDITVQKIFSERLDDSSFTTLFQIGDRQEERGDIIKFYNQVFVEEIKSFATKFSNFSENLKNHTSHLSYYNTTPLLSPLPLLTPLSQSPRKKVSANHLVYVSPLKKVVAGSCSSKKEFYGSRDLSGTERFHFPQNATSSAFKNLTNHFTYSINASPSKDLEKLNSMIRYNHRLLTVTKTSVPTPLTNPKDVGGDFILSPPISSEKVTPIPHEKEAKKLKLEPILVPTTATLSAKRGLHF